MPSSGHRHPCGCCSWPPALGPGHPETGGARLCCSMEPVKGLHPIHPTLWLPLSAPLSDSGWCHWRPRSRHRRWCGSCSPIRFPPGDPGRDLLAYNCSEPLAPPWREGPPPCPWGLPACPLQAQKRLSSPIPEGSLLEVHDLV